MKEKSEKRRKNAKGERCKKAMINETDQRQRDRHNMKFGRERYLGGM